MADFNFIRNDRLRSVIERDYAELRGLSPSESLKATVVLAGVLLEGVLTDALTVAGRWDFDSACQQRLSELIRAAKANGIIKQDHLSNTVKNYRDLVHPGREVRKGVELTKDDADLARAAVNLTIRDMLLWYETPSGKQRLR